MLPPPSLAPLLVPWTLLLPPPLVPWVLLLRPLPTLPKTLPARPLTLPKMPPKTLPTKLLTQSRSNSCLFQEKAA